MPDRVLPQCRSGGRSLTWGLGFAVPRKSGWKRSITLFINGGITRSDFGVLGATTAFWRINANFNPSTSPGCPSIMSA